MVMLCLKVRESRPLYAHIYIFVLLFLKRFLFCIRPYHAGSEWTNDVAHLIPKISPMGFKFCLKTPFFYYCKQGGVWNWKPTYSSPGGFLSSGTSHAWKNDPNLTSFGVMRGYCVWERSLLGTEHQLSFASLSLKELLKQFSFLFYFLS